MWPRELIRKFYPWQHTKRGPGWFPSFIFPRETVFLPCGHFHQKHHAVPPGASGHFVLLAALKARRWLCSLSATRSWVLIRRATCHRTEEFTLL